MPAEASQHLLPATQAQHTVESLLAMHGGGRSWVYWLTLAGVIGGLACLPLLEVDVSINAPGIVRPATERVELRLPTGGRIARLQVRDNERVVAGQVLLELETPDLDERASRNSSQRREKAAVLDLLGALANARAIDAGVIPGGDANPAGEEYPALRALRQEAMQLAAQLEANRLAAAKAGTELARASALAEKGIATQRELDDARYALERVQAEGRLLIEQARTRWHARSETETAHLEQLVSENRRIDAERALAVLRAPIDGTVQGLVGFTPGAFVTAGLAIGTVSPDDRLLVETLVSSRDIGLIRVGQSVRLQVDAFPYTQWGLLEGNVMGIAADASTTGGGNATVFKVTVEPVRFELTRANGAAGHLGKGMTVSARFLTSRRTLLQVLYQDASEWLDPQNRPHALRP